MIERTFVAIKPDGVQRGLIGEIIKRFEQRGLKVVALKLALVDNALADEHYAEHKGKKFFSGLKEFIRSGPVVAMVIEGVHAIEQVRKIVGSTEPKSSALGTIRGDFAHVSYAYADQKGITVKNLIHASANNQDAGREIDLWFKKEDIHSYPAVHDVYIF
ncbi:nucleoside-diphosphate kinase [Candidatus Woesearchaeota archaeon]|nr:nucleoside-diphosphate kinase [Candidatus Woesearchaeota archaeon]